MNGFSNSLFCTPDIGLLKLYLKLAVDKSSLKTLKGIDKNQSQKLVSQFVVPAVEESIKDCSNVGDWKDEKDYVLIKIHGWFFMSWMTTRLGITGEIFPSIGTAFYSEILRICQFQEYLIQCLCNVDETTAAVLIEDIASNVGEDKTSLLLKLVEHCLQQLGCSNEKLGRILSTRLSHILSHIAKNVELQPVQVDILSKLNNKVNILVQQLQNHCIYLSGNAFTEKMNIIEFNERLSDIMDGIEETKATMKTASKLDSNPLNLVKVSAKGRSQELVQAIISLFSCINYVITTEWKSLFHWQLNDLGCNILVGVKDSKCHGLLFGLFTACKSLQTLTEDNDLVLCKELQCMADVLEPCCQEYETSEKKSCFHDIASDQCGSGESFCVADEIEMTNKTMEEKLQSALYQVDENLLGDELCFEWLLLKEELYVEKRWLICVETQAKKFVSIKIMKMLLDVLSVLQEFDIAPGGVHENIDISLKKVILDLLTHLTLPEQKEVVLYNFDLTCLHGHSFFLHPDNKRSESFLENILTGTMNKLVKNAGFSKSIMDGIMQSCLVSPYLTLKELLTKASERAGYEKVICELLQVIPWLVDLGYNNDDKLLIQVLKHKLECSHVFSKKQERQFLKLIEALMQPYIHPDFGTKEAALVATSDVTKHVVMALLTHDVISPALPLHVLIKCLSCGLTSMDQKAHCTVVDRDHALQLLFVVLEIHEEIEQFWVDWRTESGSLNDMMEDFDDVMLLDVWDQMDVTFKIIEEHLMPFLTEDVSREPHRYSSYISTLQDHLKKLDWISSLFVTPLLQTDVFKGCTIQSPSSLANLLSSHFKVEPIQETGTKSFWKIYFQSCANSNEVFGVLISKLHESHPRDAQVGCNESDEIIHNAANLLPFTTQTQWQRILEVMVQMMKCKYLKLDDEWKSDLMALPNISNVVGNDLIKTSELLILLLRDMSKTEWGTSCIWIVTLKNYISSMKKLSLEINTENKFEITCHLLVHLANAAFKIVPESFEERITIILLDLFNQGLLCISSKETDESVQYLQGIINMISRNELRLAMINTMDKMLSKNVGK